ncbi:MAG TPA: LLM class flavin-dependent oxidoreductase, partial [Acidimicrobiales bacterium]
MWGLHFDMRAPSFGAPRTALYENALEMTSWAEQHGCVNVTLSEHHFEDDGYLPSPLVMAAAVAARTSKIRITVSALVLPLHDPIRAAEDVLVVDQISKGRLVVVLVPGYSAREFAGYGVDHASRGALLEQHAVTFVSALSGEPIDRAGTPVRLTPPAVQQPRPIVLVGGSSLAAARRAARV